MYIVQDVTFFLFKAADKLPVTNLTATFTGKMSCHSVTFSVL